MDDKIYVATFEENRGNSEMTLEITRDYEGYDDPFLSCMERKTEFLEGIVSADWKSFKGSDIWIGLGRTKDEALVNLATAFWDGRTADKTGE